MPHDKRPFGHVHLFTNRIDFGMDSREPLDAPRAFHLDGAVQVELGVAPSVVVGLRARGPAVVIDGEQGALAGASDHRWDGRALGFRSADSG